MPARKLYMTATGMTGIKEISFTEGMSQPTATADILCVSHTHQIGSIVTAVDLGFTTDHDVMLAGGVVKAIEYLRPQEMYRLRVQDVLVRAVDNFLAPDDPEAAFMADNIAAEDLVRDLLSNSGLTSYTGEATGFTFATQEPAPIKLVTAWDMIANICKITGRVCYADDAGQVHFVTRKPYIVGGDTSVLAIAPGSGGNLSRISYVQSDSELRNRVVVYGKSDVHATASDTSPYLTAGYYKSMVIAHELIDSQAQAQAAADLNLLMFNRLTETLTVGLVGNTLARARAIVDVTDAFCGLSADEFVVFGAKHTVSDQAGYAVELTLVR